jgi:hypothetical protein
VLSHVAVDLGAADANTVSVVEGPVTGLVFPRGHQTHLPNQLHPDRSSPDTRGAISLAAAPLFLCCAPFVFKNKNHPLSEHAGNMCFPRVAIDFIFIYLAALAMINRIVDGILMALSWQ